MKTLIIAEVLCIVLALTGFGLRIGLVFLGIPLLIVGLLSLSGVYFARGLRPVLLNNQPQAASDRFFVPLYKLGHMLFAVSMLGLLLKTMLWDMAFLGMGVVLLLPFVFFVALQLLKGKVFFKKLLVKSILITSVVLAFYQAPTGTLINIYYRNHPLFAKTFIEYRQNPNDALKKKKYLEARKELLKKTK